VERARAGRRTPAGVRPGARAADRRGGVADRLAARVGRERVGDAGGDVTRRDGPRRRARSLRGWARPTV